MKNVELGDALDVRSVGASPTLYLLHRGCVFYRFVVYRWCLASTASEMHAYLMHGQKGGHLILA